METKDDLLNKLRSYSKDPDDDVIRLKKEIEHILLSSPELLYALNEKKLENELFTKDGKINWDEDTKEPLGEWDRYFGSNGNIRPFLFIPDTQTETKHYICYQINTTENERYNSTEKYLVITFTIFIHGGDRIDTLTGIPRHDLIASIIREKIAWSGINNAIVTVPIGNKESTTDTNYLVRELKYQITMPNDLVMTHDGYTSYINKRR